MLSAPRDAADQRPGQNKNRGTQVVKLSVPFLFFFASAVVPNTAGAAPEAAEQTVLPLPVEKRKEWRNGAERLQTLLFFWCNVVRIS